MEKLYYKEYYKLEREHWWFKARLHILEYILCKKIYNGQPLKVLNAGAATGSTSTMLKQYGEVCSLEYDTDCAEILAEILGEDVSNTSLTDLPFERESYDLVCAFDVVEHIEDDNKALFEINRVLNEEGYVFLTVPAFQMLWNKHDEINHHFRRYRMNELKELLENNGFTVIYYSYFNFLLFTPILLVRFFSKLLPPREKVESTGSDFEKFSSNDFLNQVLYLIFYSEKNLLGWNLKLPFGVSAMIIGQKIDVTQQRI